MKADIIIKNSNLITVNEDDDIKESLAISGNRIIGVGDNEEIKRYQGGRTKIIDCNGRSTLPGFIDSHIHFLGYGIIGVAMIDLTYPKVKSIKDIQKIIRKEVEKKGEDAWIILTGYDHNKLDEKRHPKKEDLDLVAPNNPVQCIRVCGHMGVYNSKALEMGNYLLDRVINPKEIHLDSKGKMTGLLKETAHMTMGEIVKIDEEAVIDSFKNANQLMLENGITSVHDAGASGGDSLRIMQYVSEKGIVQTRQHPMIYDIGGKAANKELIDNYIRAGIYTGLGNENFSLGPIKIMIDGSSSGPSAKMLSPYSHDNSSSGILVWTQEEADETIKKAHDAGFQVTAHALGDKAVTIMVNAIERALLNNPREDHRHRIEHCGFVNEELLDRIERLGIIPIANPGFISINGSDYNRYYGERVEYMFPLRSFLDKGIIAAVGSDAPVTNPNPMLTIYGALNRNDMNTKIETGVSQRVDILDIIRMHTYNGAYASFEEDIKGSLEVGKLADIIILSENIMDYPKEDIMDVKVDYTIIDGVIEYKR